MAYRTFWRTEDAQATVEAAFILPVIILCMGLSVQPILCMYTKSLMQEAALEGVRFAMSEEDKNKTERFVRRRLEAIPASEIFHAGSDDDWNIEIVRSQETVSITIVGHMKEIPLLGTPSLLYLDHDEAGIVLKASASGVISPSWREGSYEQWAEQFR